MAFDVSFLLSLVVILRKKKCFVDVWVDAKFQISQQLVYKLGNTSSLILSESNVVLVFKKLKCTNTETKTIR